MAKPKAATAPEKPTHALPEKLLSTLEVCKILGVSRNTFYELVECEGLPIVQIGRNYRTHPSALEVWLESRQSSQQKG